MELVCPLCNGLKGIESNCPQCGAMLEDGGAIENYYGPYSPYMENDAEVIGDEMYCTHLLYCPSCGFDSRFSLKMISI